MASNEGEKEDARRTSDERSFSGEGKHDEEQQLLASWKDDESEEVDQPDERKSSPGIWQVRYLVLPTLLCIAAVALGIALVFILRTVTGEYGPFIPEIISNDYLLDTHWDTESLPQRREFKWTIRDHEHSPDSIWRPMILVNNQFPGPMIEANEGDTIVVHVDNQAVNATSLHWHGIYQNGTPHMDGTVGITQCPIAPGSRFTYEFTVAEQTGTYWWHGHNGVQSSDGLHGPLIIHSRKEKDFQQLEYASDRVVLISDHYHDLSSALLWQYLKPDMENAEPVPNGGLINGKSVQNCDLFPDRICDNSSAHVVTPSFQLKAGERHRLRLINVGAFAEFQVQVDEHELAVTEVDGTDVVPANYHRLHISPAQRYSVVINADSTDRNSFWLRARMITKCFTDPPENLQPEVRAVVSYGNGGAATGQIPMSKDWDEMLDLECKDMNAADLVPAQAVSAPVRADAFFYLRANFEIGAYRLARGFFNSSSWRPKVSSPTLLRSADGLSSGNSSFAAKSGQDNAFVNDAAFDASRELVIQTDGVQTIDILVSNFDDGNHPLHLHGYKYFVLAQGHGYPPLTYVGADITPDNLTPLYDSLDLSNPLRRDTASVEAFGWVLLRLVADNPGAWAFHCHLAWHSEAGLLMQFLTRTDELAHLEIPEDNRRLCAAPGIRKGLGPDDADYKTLAR